MAIKRVLILSANPSNAGQLRLEKEIREIRNVIMLSDLRDQIELNTRGAVQPDDLQQYLLEIKPQIIHFCGHSSTRGLIVENEEGFANLVPSSALASLLNAWVNRNEKFPEKFEAIILNSCYSQSTSLELSKYSDNVIGMPSEITDDIAIAFSRGIYRGIGAGLPIKSAFSFGCNAIELAIKDLPSEIKPVLVVNEKVFEGDHIKKLAFTILTINVFKQCGILLIYFCY